MTSPPFDHYSVEHEEKRLAALSGYEILDTPEEAAFDEIVEVASLICEAPIAVINFIDRDRQWFKSVKGLCVRETPLDVSICSHAILQPGLFIVPDTTLDARFANNPLVTGDPYLRFYAGALLKSHNGYPLGTLCVLDHHPRDLTEKQRYALQALANQVMAHMELMRSHREQAALIKELEAVREELAHLASTDSLTGLLNRRAFEQRLTHEFALIKRGAPSAALMLIDLDHFKCINDKFGHQIGDEALLHFATLARKVFRGTDTIGRWGGEEFLVLLPNTAAEQALAVAERLRNTLARTPVQSQGHRLIITVSTGLIELQPERSLPATLKLLDDTLYHAKEEGRNRTLIAG